MTKRILTYRIERPDFKGVWWEAWCEWGETIEGPKCCKRGWARKLRTPESACLIAKTRESLVYRVRLLAETFGLRAVRRRR